MKAKETICLLACAVFYWATKEFSMLWAIPIAMLFLFIGIFLANAFDFWMDLIYHAGLKEDIHEGHTHPKDRLVYKRVQHHRKMLILSGNPFYNFKQEKSWSNVFKLMREYKKMKPIKDDPKGAKINVDATLFRDHLNPTELWDEYLVRRKEEEEVKIKKTAIRHYQDEGKNWSWEFKMNQKGAYTE